MWISKRKWNEMEDKVNDLEKRNNQIGNLIPTLVDRTNHYEGLNKNVEKLISAHKEVEETEACIRGGVKLSMFSKTSYKHHSETVDTSNISDITLEELARLVIDHEPIVREENVKVKVEYR